MRLTTFCAAVLSSSLFLFASCSSIPHPFEEREPWQHAMAQARRAAHREAEHVVRAAKLQSNLKSGVTLSDRQVHIGSYGVQAVHWHKIKMSWLKEARRKGFTGDDSEADPKWYLKWKRVLGHAD